MVPLENIFLCAQKLEFLKSRFLGSEVTYPTQGRLYVNSVLKLLRFSPHEIWNRVKAMISEQKLQRKTYNVWSIKTDVKKN